MRRCSPYEVVSVNNEVYVVCSCLFCLIVGSLLRISEMRCDLPIKPVTDNRIEWNRKV